VIWKVEFDSDAMHEFARLDKSVQNRILRYLRQRIATDQNPRRFGAPLRKSLTGFWKYRIGDYRLICKVDDNTVTVVVVNVGHRKNIYLT
jgi:mRNA interferase RelE/StbE